MKSGDADLTGFKVAVVSSVFQVSKILNSSLDGSYFRYLCKTNLFTHTFYFVTRCYPKVDESVYVFDPSGKMSADSETALTEELGEKVST